MSLTWGSHTWQQRDDRSKAIGSGAYMQNARMFYVESAGTDSMGMVTSPLRGATDSRPKICRATIRTICDGLILTGNDSFTGRGERLRM